MNTCMKAMSSLLVDDIVEDGAVVVVDAGMVLSVASIKINIPNYFGFTIWYLV